MKNLILILIGVAFGLNASAQLKTNREIKGDKHFFVYSFKKSIDYYSNTKDLSPEGQRNLAESYYNTNQNLLAEEAYSKLISTNQELVANDYFIFARLLKANGKNDQSINAMDRFAELYPNDLRAKDYLANKSTIADLNKDNGKYVIKTLDVNTDAHDFGPIYYKDKIIFSSTKSAPKMIVKNYNWTGEPFWSIYIADVKDGQLINAKAFNKDLSSNLHDGPASFSNDDTFMAFTQNNSNDKSNDNVVELQIHFSTLVDGEWSEPTPFNLNNTEYSVGHPSLTADGKTLFFASDIPGGYGGSDIYKTTRNEDGTWGEAENLGNKINTESDELFPFIDETSETLYFSSNGRFGLGGMDVFVAKLNGSTVQSVKNAGYPLNSNADDYAIIVNSSSTKGYISSDRAGGIGGEDIYAFDIMAEEEIILVEKHIVGKAIDENSDPLTNTFVTLFDDNGMVLDTLTTQDDGAFTFNAGTNQNFSLSGKKDKYNNGFAEVNTHSDDAIIKADIMLLTKKELYAEREELAIGDLAFIVEFGNIYFDFDKYNIRNDAKSELNNIIEVMNENPRMTMELGSHTDCRGSNAYNQTLSKQRSEATAEYIRKNISNPSRISTKAYGETKLFSDCPCSNNFVSECSEVNHQKNRRTEFVVINHGLKNEMEAKK